MKSSFNSSLGIRKYLNSMKASDKKIDRIIEIMRKKGIIIL
tara:strand:+ start:281 stop:403 length:123 start_codon:yes stop_codon:yes gene_type:complete